MSSNIKIEINPDGIDALSKDISDNISKSGINITCPECGKDSIIHSNEFHCPYCGHQLQVEFRL